MITGTKAFGSGEILSSSDVNQYLMRGVKVFGGTAARDSAYGGSGEPALEEGEAVFLTDIDTVQVYAGTAVGWINIGPNTDPSPNEIAVFCEEQASGTNGGTFTAGSWVKRTLNTTRVNNISGCSISSSVVTLADPGTYLFSGSAPHFAATSVHRTRIQNTTDATTAVEGTNDYCGFSNGHSRSFVHGLVTIAGSKDFEFQHRCTNTAATTGFGVPTGFGVEIYSELMIVKVA